jgi:nucleoside-diphosphate-sugar epimerase
MKSGFIFLTGSTGLLGRYLLRELLATGQPVAVLVRDSRGRSARERIEEIVSFACETLGRSLPQPTVVSGDLTLPNCGLGSADHDWLANHCRSVIHAAACISLRRSPKGEPWLTNVDGTRRLLELTQRLGIAELHHVSTAFVCGMRKGAVYENDLAVPRDFHNEYEQSKLEAEGLVRSANGIRASVYRPSVIIGDSVTGYTSSYHGFYRFLELGDRLAEPSPTGRRTLRLRLPFGGDEPRNLVPVDWVARAIVQILKRDRTLGLTFHLTSPASVPGRLVKEVAAEVLGIDGVHVAGPGEPSVPGSLEDAFREYLQEYWPYVGGEPEFDSSNTQAALPDHPCPRIDREMLARMIRFGMRDRWGWGRRGKPRAVGRFNCREYVERFFPAAAASSTLSKVPIDLTLGVVIDGAGGGNWTVRLRPEQVAEVQRELPADPSIVYRMDTATLEAIVRGRQSPQAAFFERRIEIRGDVEKALKLAVLFEQFVRENPYATQPVPEKHHANALPI